MALSRRERREQRWKLLKEERLSQLKEESPKKEERTTGYKGVLGIYDKHYKKLLIIPIIILVISLVLFGYQIATTGDFINKGVSLKGGAVITVPVKEQIDSNSIEQYLKTRFPDDDLSVRVTIDFGIQKAIIITTDHPENENSLIDALSQKMSFSKKDVSIEITGSSLGESFFRQTTLAMIVAFLFMSIVVFISFRSPAPSAMVVISVFADIIETIVAVNLLGLKVNTAGIAAFLMLIGYSVDTDILLTSRVLRGKEGTVFQRVLSATRTGLLMTSTAIVAVVVSLIFTQNDTIKEIMIIMVFGLFFDIINTWLQNTALLRWYLEWRGKKPTAVHSKEVEPEIIDIDEDVQ